jgi:hypothetical protein
MLWQFFLWRLLVLLELLAMMGLALTLSFY